MSNSELGGLMSYLALSVAGLPRLVLVLSNRVVGGLQLHRSAGQMALGGIMSFEKYLKIRYRLVT